MKNKTLGFTLFLVALMSIGVTFFIPKKKVKSLSLSQLKVETDSPLGGHSNITLIKNQANLISWVAELKPGIAWPFVSIHFPIQNNGQCQDWSQVDSLSITLSNTSKTPLNLNIKTAIPLKMRSHFNENERILTQLIPTQDHLKELNIPMSRFRIPEWWKTQAKIEVMDDRSFSEQTCELGFANGYPQTALNSQDTIELSSIKLYSTIPPRYSLGFLFLGLSLSGLLLLLFKPVQLGVIQLPQPEKIQISNLKKELIEKINSAYSSLYRQADLDMNEIASHIGIHPKKLQITLKEELQTQHKILLNQIRLTEAKRLLLESELPISEIAYSVGYSSIPHFNRVFKEKFQSTPTIFRTENKVKST